MLFRSVLIELLPRKLIAPILLQAQIALAETANQISKEKRRALCEKIKALPVTVTKTRPYAEAVITRGGVDVRQIHPATMESKLQNGVYFAGEVLDVDGFTGGFNLQIAFSTGYAAGSAIGMRI